MRRPGCSGFSTRCTRRRKRRYGLDPPGDAEPLHHELTWALGGARDATAEVAEALDEQGLDGVAPLLHEWRGALFRVRLARLRLAAPKPAAEPAAVPGASGLRAGPAARRGAARPGRRARVRRRSRARALAGVGRRDRRRDGVDPLRTGPSPSAAASRCSVRSRPSSSMLSNRPGRDLRAGDRQPDRLRTPAAASGRAPRRARAEPLRSPRRVQSASAASRSRGRAGTSRGRLRRARRPRTGSARSRGTGRSARSSPARAAPSPDRLLVPVDAALAEPREQRGRVLLAARAPRRCTPFSQSSFS